MQAKFDLALKSHIHIGRDIFWDIVAQNGLGVFDIWWVH